MSTSTPRYHVCCITHEDGVLHVRSTIEGYPFVGRVLTDAGLDWTADLAEDLSREGHLVVRDLRVALAEPGDVGATLQRAGAIAHAYAPFYDTDGEGPTVKFERVCAPPAVPEDPWVHNIDFGFHAGSWYLGHPGRLEQALASARRLGLQTWEVRRGDLHAFAVDAQTDATTRLNAALTARGLVVADDVFRPLDFFDDPEDPA